MLKNQLWLLLIFAILLSNCKEKEQKTLPSYSDILVEEGFIIKTEKSLIGTSVWYFVSAKSLYKKDWFVGFETKNLENGFRFNDMGHDGFPESFIEKHMDTLHLPNTTGDRFYTFQLMLFPVRIEYKLKPEFRDKQTRFEFVQDIGEREVKFGFNSLPVNIQNIIPLAPPKWAITECKCEPREDDANGYLYKICIYLKEQGEKYSDVPCNYSIREVEVDTLNGKQVVRVNLNCCYLGDVALFDSATKELIDFSYGPR